MEEPKTKRDENGNLLIRSKCSCCKQCWIYLGGPLKGTCPYNGPYSGYEKEGTFPIIETTKASSVPAMPSSGTRPPWE